MVLHLFPRERRRLEEITRYQRGEARLYRRARMVLLAASGSSVSSIARQLGTCRLRVGQWLHRFQENRVDGLRDRQRSGRPSVITPLERHQVIATACCSPGDFGLDHRTWTLGALRDALVL